RFCGRTRTRSACRGRCRPEMTRTRRSCTSCSPTGRPDMPVRGLNDTVAVIVWPADDAALNQTVRALNRVASHVGIPVSVHLVDDGPRARTPTVASAARAHLLRCRSRGYGDVIAASVAAIDAAYVVTLEGDGSHPPDLLPSLCA